MSNLHSEEVRQAKKPRYGTGFSVEFPQLPTMTQRPYEVELIQKRGNHDILKLMFKQTGKEYTEDIPTGLPVRFTWTQNQIKTSWVGYVSHVSRQVLANRDGVMDVVCVGSSFPLKKKATKVFVDCSIPEAVQQLAEEVGLEYVGDFSSRKFPQLTLAGQSYWAWIQEQASRLGYVAYVKGVTLYFQRIDSAINSSLGSPPVFSLADADMGLDYQGLLQRTLTRFKVLRGDYIESSSDVRTAVTIGGINPVTTEVLSGESTPTDAAHPLRKDISNTLFSTQRTDQVSFRQKDAQELAKNLTELSRFSMPAKVIGAGDARCYPNSLIKVEGTGKSSDGYWLIKEVTHSFNMYGTYTVDMLVLSDGVGEATASPFEQNKTLGRNVVNINDKLRPSGGIISARSNSSPNLSAPTLPILVKDLNFKASESRWKAK